MHEVSFSANSAGSSEPRETGRAGERIGDYQAQASIGFARDYGGIIGTAARIVWRRFPCVDLQKVSVVGVYFHSKKEVFLRNHRESARKYTKFAD